MSLSPERLEWEDAVYRAVEQTLEICRSDAQGFAEAQQHTLERAWDARLSSQDTAHRLLKTSTPQEGTS